MTIDEVNEIIDVLEGAYPYFKPNPHTLTSWTLLLADVPHEAVMAVLPGLLTESPKHPPTAPEVRSAALRLALKLPSEAEAWEEIQRLLRKHGGWEHPDPADCHPVIYRAIRAFGWNNLTGVDEEKLPTVRAQFRDLFNGFASRTVAEASAELTPGASLVGIGPGSS